MKRLIIIGAGGHGRSVAEAIQLSEEFEITGFLDDSWPRNTHAGLYPIFGNTIAMHQYRNIADWAIVAIGNNKLRADLLGKLIEAGFQLATVKHPAAIISPSAIIGEGTTIMAGAIIGTESILGKGVIVNSGATVDHDCEVANFGHLGVNTCMAGSSNLGEGAWLHAGNALGYGMSLSPWQVVPSKIHIEAT
jgi:sugar O-acyltransferase (sialic acid O-acetyltransferase NeuD family)